MCYLLSDVNSKLMANFNVQGKNRAVKNTQLSILAFYVLKLRPEARLLNSTVN